MRSAEAIFIWGQIWSSQNKVTVRLGLIYGKVRLGNITSGHGQVRSDQVGQGNVRSDQIRSRAG